MKEPAHTACLLLILACLDSCTKTGLYEQSAKTLDSLGGAVNTVVRELEQADTAALQKCITRYTWYRDFIEQSVNDTINREEADKLQQFYASGKALENFSQNRKQLMNRGMLLNTQLTRLGEDVKQRHANAEQVWQDVLHEKTEAGKLIQLGYQQQKLFHAALEEFKGSLNKVEELIRSRNKGELPTIVKDTVSI